MRKKIEIIFTFPDCQGGVANFNRNIINYCSIRSNFFIKVILIKSLQDNRQSYEDEIFADEIIRFSYSSMENQYYVCKRLNNIIGPGSGYVVTDNDLTIKSIIKFRNQKALILLVHDYFYLQFALAYEPYISACIAHSSFYRDILISARPSVFYQKAVYIPYGVDQKVNIKKNHHNELNLVFLARLVPEKGIFLLRQIEDLLESNLVKAHWSIIGSGPCKEEVVAQWKDKTNLTFYNPKTTTEIYNILSSQDILVLPSAFEGTPVSILESITNGVVPVVSDLPGGIQEIVTSEIGFRCIPNNPESFAKSIIFLSNNRNILATFQAKARNFANEKYNIQNSADNYFNLFTSLHSSAVSSKIEAKLFSRLDKKYFPNKLVHFIRKLI